MHLPGRGNMILDKIVFNTTAKPLKKRLLREEDPSLTNVKEACAAYEMTQAVLIEVNGGQIKQTNHR